ncbi:hypothetical protein EJB05_19676, partial [Eragrostis curvula]
MRSLQKLLEATASVSTPHAAAHIHAHLFRSGCLYSAHHLTARVLASYPPGVARELFDEIPGPTPRLANALLRAHLRGASGVPRSASPRASAHGRTASPFRSCSRPAPCSRPSPTAAPCTRSPSAPSPRPTTPSSPPPSCRCTPGAGTWLLPSTRTVRLRSRTSCSGQSVVTGYEQNGLAEEALEFFARHVVGQGITPSSVTLVSVMSAAAQLGDVQNGKACHAFVLRRGLEYELALANAVLGFYTKIGAVEAARRLFEGMANRDVITWSSMVKAYVQCGDTLNAMRVYREMVESGVQLNSVTLVSVLQACSLAADVEEGRRIHHIAVNIGCELELGVGTALVDMYMKCSCHEEAIRLFHRMPKKDAVAWAAVISGLTQNGLPDGSLKVFKSMLLNGLAPDAVTMVKVLAACSESGVISQAICLHGYLVRSGFCNKVFVAAALVDLYSKCGNLDSAVKIFENATEKDVVLWSSMIAGYGVHGLGKEAVALYQRMIASSVKPSSVTFVSLLSACGHSGLVQEGKQIFDSMIQVYGIMPNTEHQCAIVDLLGRAGKLQEATRVINEMGGRAVAHTWCALLAACRAHNNTEMSEIVAKNLLGLDPDHVGYYNLLVNIYAFDQKWDSVKKTRDMARGKCLNKVPGYSAVEVNNVMHKFISGETSHQDWEKICTLLWELSRKLRDEVCSFHLNNDLAPEEFALL